jgi:hypothetical protein
MNDDQRMDDEDAPTGEVTALVHVPRAHVKVDDETRERVRQAVGAGIVLGRPTLFDVLALVLLDPRVGEILKSFSGSEEEDPNA